MQDLLACYAESDDDAEPNHSEKRPAENELEPTKRVKKHYLVEPCVPVATGKSSRSTITGEALPVLPGDLFGKVTGNFIYIFL